MMLVSVCVHVCVCLCVCSHFAECIGKGVYLHIVRFHMCDLSFCLSGHTFELCVVCVTHIVHILVGTKTLFFF